MTGPPPACDLKAFGAGERQRYASLTGQLRSAVIEERELDDGYAFRISTEVFPPATIAEWIALERRCCPFFAFDLRFEADQGPVWLHITGPSGAKDIIREELGAIKKIGN